MTPFPHLATIRQPVPSAPLADVAQAARGALAALRLGRRVAPGARIAVAAGSRGIANHALIVRTVVEELRALGAQPFVFPAMGSHGGATAEGQRALLAEAGITEQVVGCPVHSSMDVVQVGRTSTGIPVFCDAGAYASDGIVLVNRVKAHTDFHGRTESGLTKMLAIGLGKRQGAELIHAHGTRGLREEIPRVAAVLLTRAPVLCGVAVVEDGAHRTSWVQAVLAHDIPFEEPRILARARALAPGLPLEACDLLIVDRIGKDISGAGMDTNVIGRVRIDGEPEPDAPQVGLIVALRLSEASGGNATGVGFADLVPQQMINAIDAHVTRVNIATSGFPLRGSIPPVEPNDRAAIRRALEMLRERGRADPTILRIHDTLSLAELQVSANLLPELLARPGVELLAGPSELRFRPDGSLV